MRAGVWRQLRVGLLLLLSACGAGGTSTPSGDSVPTSQLTTAPGAPTNVSAAPGNGAIVLAFNPPVSTGGSSISAYSATCAGSPGQQSAAGQASPLTVAGLTNGVLYTCSVTASNAAGVGPASTAVQATPADPAATNGFRGSILLGAPEQTSIKLKIFSPDQNGSVLVVYGRAPGSYSAQTSQISLTAGKPLDVSLQSLSPDTKYFYRLFFQAAGAGSSTPSAEYGFHTARSVGSTFTFTIQSDSHLDENSDLEIYRRTLANVLADQPDFHIDLGDTFMTEKYSTPLTANSAPAMDQASVNARYVYERANFGLISHSAPVFLVNGNHDGELGWLDNGTAQNLAVWTTQARQQYFLNPPVDSFYSGDPVDEPIVGQRASWYAWRWGDALFIVLDPFWNSKRQANSDSWNLTLGIRQYNWLASTLAASTAAYKFVFLHNLVGGLDGQMRGGIEAAPYYEWGGRNSDGSPGFTQKRPGWGAPIHDLLVQNHVTAVFHGHDHFYGRQVLDGVIYQEVPQPSAKNFNNGASIANDYHYSSGAFLSSSGHIRVTVSPTGVKSEYVRSWLPKDETSQRRNGQIDDTWTAGSSR